MPDRCLLLMVELLSLLKSDPRGGRSGVFFRFCSSTDDLIISGVRASTGSA